MPRRAVRIRRPLEPLPRYRPEIGRTDGKSKRVSITGRSRHPRDKAGVDGHSKPASDSANRSLGSVRRSAVRSNMPSGADIHRALPGTFRTSARDGDHTFARVVT